MKNNLHSLPIGMQLPARRCRDVNAIVADVAGDRHTQPQNRLAEGGFAGAGLPNECQRFAARHRERNVINGVNITGGALEDPFQNRIVDANIL